MKKFILLCFALGISTNVFSQYFIDSCFSSATPSTSFTGNTSIWGQDADLMQWTGSSWTGSWPGANLTIAPPAGGSGCRAIFTGNSSSWTSGGEIFGIRLVSPLVAGTTYSIPFTYVSHGTGSTGAFAPYIYSNNTNSYTGAVSIGTLPSVGYTWTTNVYTFTATAAQNGHTYILVGTKPSGTSGMISSYCCDLVAPCNVNLGPDQTVCSGSTVTLNATTTGASYLWSTGATSATISVTTTGSYWVQISVGACTDRDTVLVTVNPNPTVNLGADQTICAGQTATFNATTTGATYLWSTGATTPTITTGTAGNYAVTVTVNGCTGTDNANLTVNPNPTVNIGADQTICAGQTATFNATTTGATYLWSTGATTPTITTGTAGNYAVTVTVSGCTGTDNANLIVNPNPTVNIGADQAICAGQSATFNATTTGATYLWSTGATTPTITTGTAGNYTVTVTVSGCTGTDNANLAVNPNITVNIGADQTICAGQTATFDATATGATYLWSTGATTPTISTGTAGNYSVTVTASGCSGSDDVNLLVNPVPVVDLGPDLSLCFGEDTLLDASQTGASYLWSDGSTNSNFPVLASGDYWVQVTLAGCTASDTIHVDIQNNIVVDLGLDTTVCEGNSVLLDAGNSGAAYLWNTSETTQTISVSAAGQYSVLVSIGNCYASDTINIQNYPSVVVDLGADQSICPGDFIVLDAGNAGADAFVWSTGDLTQTLNAGSAGTYTVHVTMNGCTGSDDIIISMLQDPTVDLGDDLTMCEGSNEVLYATFPGSSYIWQDGSTDDHYFVTSTGVYSVSVTNICSTVSDSVTVTMLDCNCSVFIPNAFSPVRDEINDIFIPVSTCGWRTFDLKVYDRWGNLLFESQDCNKGWDGMFKGSLVTQDVYSYIFHYTLDTQSNIKEVAYGFVFVLRQP